MTPETSYRLGSFARRVAHAAPELAFGGSSAAHGLLVLRAGWAGWAGWAVGVALLLAGFEAAGGEPLAEAAGFLEGFALGFDLAFEHVQRAAADDEHGVGNDHGVVGIEPAGIFFALFQRVLGALVDEVIGGGQHVERDGVDGFCLAEMDGPRELVAVDDEDFVVAAQLAEAGAGDVGELHLGILGGGGSLGAFDDVLATAAGSLGHLVVLAALGVVEFFDGLAVVEGEKTATETQGLELDDGGQREGVELAETAVFVEQLRHCGVTGGTGVTRLTGGTGLTGLTELTASTRSMPSARSIPSFLATWSSWRVLARSFHKAPLKAWWSKNFFNASSAASFCW